MAFGNDPSTGTFSPTQGNVDAILKEIYSDDGITDEFFTQNPFYTMCPKDENVPGRNFDQPVWASTGQARSRTFGSSTSGPGLQAMANISGEKPYVFLVPKLENMAVANVSSKAIAESSTSKGAFVDMVRAIADNQLQGMVNDVALGMFRGADINRANVGGSVAGATLTLANPADATNLELGQFLEFAATNSGTSVRALASNNTDCHITAVDYSSGVFTVAWTGSGTQTLTANNVAVGDFIYAAGDKSLGYNGFTDWIPYGGVGSGDSFLSVNRSAQATRLAGNYLDGTTGPLEEVLERAINRVALMGKKLTHFFMPYGQFTALANAQGSKVQTVNLKSGDNSKIGFEGITVTGSTGPVICLADRSCPSNLIAGVNLNTWKLISVKKAVHILQDDGKVWLRNYNANGMEIRFYSLANLVCKEPVANINIRVNPIAV